MDETSRDIPPLGEAAAQETDDDGDGDNNGGDNRTKLITHNWAVLRYYFLAKN